MLEKLCAVLEADVSTDDSTEATSVDAGPSLFDEIDEALRMCTLVYTLTQLRRLVKERKIEKNTAGAIMKLPMSMKEAVDLVITERHHLTLAKYAEDKRVFTNIVKTLSDRQYSGLSPRISRTRSDPERIEDASECFITAFGGESVHGALVYGISVNHERKIVTLCFRGAETDVDWAPLNTRVYMKEMPNPMKRHSSQRPTIKIHNQLHELLIDTWNVRDTSTAWARISGYQEILEEQVVPTLLEHPGYKLYVTGQSLGGAIASLYAFLAAAESDSMIPKPVTCISFGSCYIGDESFRAAHQRLEGLRKLRHVRISNDKDPVTLSPKVSFRWKLFDKEGYGGTPFKHVGLNLKFYPGSTPFVVSYPTANSNFIATGFDEITRAWDNSILTSMSCNPGDYISWPLHQIREYNKRVMRSRESLEATTMSGLYNDPVIVGNLYSWGK